MEKSLNTMPYASAHVETRSDGTMDLISYRTLVVHVDAEGWLECTGLYSATTRKHIGAFMRSEVSKLSGHDLSYYTAKRCYENGEKINIYTGEVVPVA